MSGDEDFGDVVGCEAGLDGGEDGLGGAGLGFGEAVVDGDVGWCRD